MVVHAWQVELGLVWVWPESSPEAWIESAAQQPALCPLVKDLDPGKAAPPHMPLIPIPCKQPSFCNVLTSIHRLAHGFVYDMWIWPSAKGMAVCSLLSSAAAYPPSCSYVTIA